MNHRHLALRRHREGQAHLQHLHGATTQYHTLYLVEDVPTVQDADTGLWVPAIDPDTGEPYADPQKVTAMAPHPPRVVLGGAERVVAGGATMRVGDAHVTHIRRDFWPLERLLAASGFRIDDPDGELFQLLEGEVVENGHNTYSLALTRMSQPRSAE